MTYDDFRSFSGEERVEDVSALDARRRGVAVRISAVLNRVEPADDATHVTLHSTDGFSASVPIASVRDVGLLIFAVDHEPLPEDAGGPIRFFVPNPASRGTAELDACANVKQVRRLELTRGAGRDTRETVGRPDGAPIPLDA